MVVQTGIAERPDHPRLDAQTPTDAEVDLIFHALADATRRDIVARAITQEQSVSSLAERYDMSFAAVQKHVAVLERAALITKERRGRQQIVHGNPATLRVASHLIDRYEALWSQRAERISQILLEPSPTTPQEKGTPS